MHNATIKMMFISTHHTVSSGTINVNERKMNKTLTLKNCWTCANTTASLEVKCQRCNSYVKKIENAAAIIKNRISYNTIEGIHSFECDVYKDLIDGKNEDRQFVFDTFFFGWMIANETDGGISKIDEEGELASIANFIEYCKECQITGDKEDINGFVKELAATARMDAGTDRFHDHFAKIISWYARVLEVSGYPKLAVHALLEGFVFLEDVKAQPSYLMVRLLGILPQNDLWDVVAGHWLDWAPNWQIATLEKRLGHPLNIMITHAIRENPVYYYLCSEDPAILVHGRLAEFPVVTEYMQVKDRTCGYISQLQHEMEFTERTYRFLGDFGFFEKMMLGRQYMIRAKARSKFYHELKYSPVVTKMVDLEFLDDYLARSNGERLAKEIWDWFKQQMSICKKINH